METSERVQKSFARTLPEFECISYNEKMDKFGLGSLESQRLRGVLTGVYNYLRDIDTVDRQTLFHRVEKLRV